MKRLPINMENYEEYFLLYVDNELTEVEKKSVEFFIARHPELMEEWTMLMDTKLEPEEIRMDLKKDLYRSTETEGIDASNFEDFQLSWIDDELSEKDRNAIEIYNSLHPEAAANMELLSKTKLPLENISFPDKSVLYRSTSRPAAVYSINWYRMAVAAAIIVAAALWFINKPVEEEVAAGLVPIAQSVPKSSEKNDTPATDQTSVENSEDKNTVEQVDPAEAINEGTTSVPSATRIPDESKTEKNISTEKTDPVKQAVNSVAGVNNSVPANVDNLNRTRVEEVVPMVTDEMVAPNQLNAQPAMALNVKSDYATEALNMENNGVSTEQLDINEEGKARKGMFRGIVRKANRFYNKVTNPDPERPIVKVANFEIGLPR